MIVNLDGRIVDDLKGRFMRPFLSVLFISGNYRNSCPTVHEKTDRTGTNNRREIFSM